MKTKHKVGLAALAFLVFLAYAGKAKAQEAPKPSQKEFRLSVGPEVGIPVGDLSDVYNWNLGGSIQADIPIVQSLYVTVNAGYNNFFIKDEFKDLGGHNMQLIPVKAGLKYFPVGNIFYVQGEAGVSFLANKSDLQANKSTAFVYAPQIGALIPLAPKNYLDVGFRWESTSSFYDGGSYANFLGLRVAYSFGL
ncbi:MAG TPA: hypothetical protein VHC96_08875 [Puia sp.]|nr:hypothetical protein [Puia sp.]